MIAGQGNGNSGKKIRQVNKRLETTIRDATISAPPGKGLQAEERHRQYRDAASGR